MRSWALDDKKVRFLPFHAINEFMREDYRQHVIRTALNALSSMPEDIREPVDRLTKKIVQVPGFRNSTKAPVMMRLKPTEDSFKKNPQLVAAILAAWAYLNPELMQQIYDLLVSRNWEVLPLEADRRKLPGFIPKWPKDENFEILYSAFSEKYIDKDTNPDDVSLMVVWVSLRLPYEFEE
jgi:hypothetical protein